MFIDHILQEPPSTSFYNCGIPQNGLCVLEMKKKRRNQGRKIMFLWYVSTTQPQGEQKNFLWVTYSEAGPNFYSYLPLASDSNNMNLRFSTFI